MPLSDREQRILEEIERQFYEEDPAFAVSVGSTRLGSRRFTPRWGIVGAVVGLLVMLVAFIWNSFVALGGFVLMAVSIAWTLTALRRGRGATNRGRWSFPLRRRSGSNG